MSFRLVPKSVTLNDLERPNEVVIHLAEKMLEFCRNIVKQNGYAAIHVLRRSNGEMLF